MFHASLTAIALLLNAYQPYEPVRAPAYQDATPLIALTLAEIQLEKEFPPPNPNPGPNPDGPKDGDPCPTCDGKGRYSPDGGGAWINCQDCKGDGKIDPGDPLSPSPAVPVPDPDPPSPISPPEKTRYGIRFEGRVLFWDERTRSFCDSMNILNVGYISSIEDYAGRYIRFCRAGGRDCRYVLVEKF